MFIQLLEFTTLKLQMITFLIENCYRARDNVIDFLLTCIVQLYTYILYNRETL